MGIRTLELVVITEDGEAQSAALDESGLNVFQRPRVGIVLELVVPRVGREHPAQYFL